MADIRIEAPADAFVIRIAESGRIAEGGELAELTSPTIDKLTSRLTALDEHIKIIERPFADGRIDEEIANVLAKVDLLTDVVKQYEELHKDILDEMKAGSANMDTLNNNNILLFQARSAVIDAKLASSQAAKKKDDLFDKVQSAKLMLQREQSYVAQQQRALTIVAPASGTFEPAIGVGSFVAKGHVVGAILS